MSTDAKTPMDIIPKTVMAILKSITCRKTTTDLVNIWADKDLALSNNTKQAGCLSHNSNGRAEWQDRFGRDGQLSRMIKAEAGPNTNT